MGRIGTESASWSAGRKSTAADFPKEPGVPTPTEVRIFKIERDGVHKFFTKRAQSDPDVVGFRQLQKNNRHGPARAGNISY